MKSIKLKDYDLNESPVEVRYDSYIKYANKIRDIIGFPYALASLCCLAVRNFRREKTGKPDFYIGGTAYFFDQFKRKEEIDLLRQVYGRLFIVISLYSEKRNRLQYLINRLLWIILRPDSHVTIATKLMNRDQLEENEKNGQRLEEAFPSADLFINLDDPDALKSL